jgi:predicted unusual protein kinase regulating ubiquinone biosynthesis (AarF/ABC1/UbiB family)
MFPPALKVSFIEGEFGKSIADIYHSNSLFSLATNSVAQVSAAKTDSQGPETS